MVAKDKIALLILGTAIVLLCIRAYYVERDGGPGITRYEKIEVKGTSVTRSTHEYFVTINFANTGYTSTSITSVSLNGVPYNDSGWTGTVKPLVFGDLEPGTVIEVGGSYCGMIIFSGDCRDPDGKELGARAMVTIYTTGGKYYDAYVILTESVLTIQAIMPYVVLVAMAGVVAFMLNKRKTLGEGLGDGK